MFKSRKVVLVIFVLILVASFALINYRSFAQAGGSFDNLTFAPQDNGLVFFDHDNGKVYIYSIRTGGLVASWQLRQLGSDLAQL